MNRVKPMIVYKMGDSSVKQSPISSGKRCLLPLRAEDFPMVNLAYCIRRGFFSHIINDASIAAPPNAVSVCICSLYPLPNVCLILSCRIGGSISIVCADCSRSLSCCDERELEDELTHLWSMLVHTARPILPPKIRACVNAPTKTAAAKVITAEQDVSDGASEHTSVLLLDHRWSCNDNQACGQSYPQTENDLVSVLCWWHSIV